MRKRPDAQKGRVRIVPGGLCAVPCKVHLDYYASTPIDPHVAGVMRALLCYAFGNPSSGHLAGIRHVRRSRRRAQRSPRCSAEVVFTSGRSEAKVWQ